MMQKWQVLRQNLVATLQHNNCELDLTHVGQDVSVRDAKKALPSSVKLVDFINKFPQNFEFQDAKEPDKPPLVVLLCTSLDSAPLPGGWDGALGGNSRAPQGGRKSSNPPRASPGVSTTSHFHKPNSSGVVPLTGPQTTY